ncbi:hypothetical protein FQA39_LY10808 [Lamprigera yunnana]|nr:hypothetical protein FQA39_LY10808 [Lamprigera yunnana]
MEDHAEEPVAGPVWDCDVIQSDKASASKIDDSLQHSDESLDNNENVYGAWFGQHHFYFPPSDFHPMPHRWAHNRYQKPVTDEELLLLENGNSDLNILSDEDDDLGGWNDGSWDEVTEENAISVTIEPINPEVNAEAKKTGIGFS